ncbi:hypothetical protein [Streptomyces sp. NBC_01716]|uniref:hypothetical protein n=1 Tax=Streptomyces sp. NBC_01716 TaxID=2975917 RepID=UPI002E2FF66F|nr:hypothetical protein [Streptomyces sp. NBC_01716]
MDLTPYVDNLRHELGVGAEAGDDEARALAERLIGPLESAVRLALLNALSDAMDEVTRELAPGSVDLRLRGRDPEFVVTVPPAVDAFDAADIPVRAPTPPAPPVPHEADEGGTSRINFRPPAQLKHRVEEAAGREGLSVNAWLVRSVAAALETTADRRRTTGIGAAAGQRFTGWVS